MAKVQKIANVFGENVLLETSTSLPYYWAVRNEAGEIEASGFSKTESACKAAMVRTLKGKDSAGYEMAFCLLETVGTSEVTPEPKTETEKTPEPETDLRETRESMLVLSVIQADMQEGSVWNQTGSIIYANRAKFEGKKTGEMSKAFSRLLDKNTDPSLVPQEGPDRKGEYITLRKKDGSVKWSSWAITARLVQNCSTIFKGISLLGFDTCFPQGILIPRSQLDKLLKELEEGKAGESPVDTIKRCVEMATKKMPEVSSKEDLVSINEYLSALLETYKEALESLK